MESLKKLAFSHNTHMWLVLLLFPGTLLSRFLVAVALLHGCAVCRIFSPFYDWEPFSASERLLLHVVFLGPT